MLALPKLAGVVFRPFRDASDYPHFARLITAFAEGEGSDRVETVEGVAAHYDHLERCDPTRDLLVAEVDALPVAYSRIWWDQEADGPIVESIRELAGRGMTEVALGVHTENPNGAFDLYAGLGYEVVGSWTTYRKPL